MIHRPQPLAEPVRMKRSLIGLQAGGVSSGFLKPKRPPRRVNRFIRRNASLPSPGLLPRPPIFLQRGICCVTLFGVVSASFVKALFAIRLTAHSAISDERLRWTQFYKLRKGKKCLI